LEAELQFKQLEENESDTNKAPANVHTKTHLHQSNHHKSQEEQEHIGTHLPALPHHINITITLMTKTTTQQC